MEAFSSATGADAMSAHLALQETRDLISQIQQKQGNNLEAMLDAAVCKVPESMPRWVPTFIARQFGEKMSTKQALVDTATRNIQNPASSSSYPPVSFAQALQQNTPSRAMVVREVPSS